MSPGGLRYQCAISMPSVALRVAPSPSARSLRAPELARSPQRRWPRVTFLSQVRAVSSERVSLIGYLINDAISAAFDVLPARTNATQSFRAGERKERRGTSSCSDASTVTLISL